MKIPETVVVGPFIYKVSLVDIVNREKPDLIGEAVHCSDK